jgi:hypothetical protein
MADTPLPKYGRNYNDPVIPRQPPVDDSQFQTLNSHQGVRYERTPSQDEQLIREAEGRFENNKYVWHSMATEHQWNYIQSRISPHSWTANVRYGRQPGIQLPLSAQPNLQPQQGLQCINIHLSQPLQSYWDTLLHAVQSQQDYLEAFFPPTVKIPKSECQCPSVGSEPANHDDPPDQQVSEGKRDACQCFTTIFPFLDALVGDGEGRIEPHCNSYHWAMAPHDHTTPMDQLSTTSPTSELDAKHVSHSSHASHDNPKLYIDAGTNRVVSDDAKDCDQPPAPVHASQHRYHALVTYICVGNMAVSSLLPAPVTMTIATAAYPTFVIDAKIPDAQLGEVLDAAWRVWTPDTNKTPTIAPYGLPLSGFMAAPGQDNRISDNYCHEMHNDMQADFDEMINEPTHSQDVASSFYQQLVDQTNSDLPVEYGLRHLLFRSSVTSLHLHFYEKYAHFDISAYVQQLLVEPFQSQDANTIMVPCDTSHAEPGVAPTTGMHLVTTFVREFIQFATPQNKLASSKQVCAECEAMPPDQLHHHRNVLEQQLANVQVNNGASSCFRFDRRRFLRVINTIITFQNQRLINFNGGIKIRTRFQVPDNQQAFILQEFERMKRYRELFEKSGTTRNLQTMIVRDQYQRLFEPGYWLSSIEIQMGAVLFRPFIQCPDVQCRMTQDHQL